MRGPPLSLCAPGCMHMHACQTIIVLANYKFFLINLEAVQHRYGHQSSLGFLSKQSPWYVLPAAHDHYNISIKIR